MKSRKVSKDILIKLLVDNCAAVNIGPAEFARIFNLLIKESNCSIICADGNKTKTSGLLDARIFDGTKTHGLKIQLLEDCQDWLLSFPELNDMGFQIWGDLDSDKSFLVCPNKLVWPLKRESDGVWSIVLRVIVDDDGNVTLEVADEVEYCLRSAPVLERIDTGESHRKRP